jgi:S1-C subfamily serine protease
VAVTQIHAWDRKLDLAVIRVAATNLHVLRLGDSDNLKQGASVVAIGNPQGLAHSIVQGVVLRGLPFKESERIIHLGRVTIGQAYPEPQSL